MPPPGYAPECGMTRRGAFDCKKMDKAVIEKQLFSSCEKNPSKKFKFLNADGVIAVQAADFRFIILRAKYKSVQ